MKRLFHSNWPKLSPAIWSDDPSDAERRDTIRAQAEKAKPGQLTEPCMADSRTEVIKLEEMTDEQLEMVFGGDQSEAQNKFMECLMAVAGRHPDLDIRVMLFEDYTEEEVARIMKDVPLDGEDVDEL